MSYLNAPTHNLFAAATSLTVTLVVCASIVFGMAGLPDASGPAVATTAPVSFVIVA